MMWAGIVIMAVLAQAPFSGKAQNLNFSGKDVPLKDILKIIKCQTGVGFFYDASLLKDAKPVTVEWKNQSLEKALQEIFKGLPITWILEDKTVTILKNPTQNFPHSKMRYYMVKT